MSDRVTGLTDLHSHSISWSLRVELRVTQGLWNCCRTALKSCLEMPGSEGCFPEGAAKAIVPTHRKWPGPLTWAFGLHL